mgnify:CR=1 FL=1
MRNKYKGQCYRCGDTVEIGDGFFERITKIQRAMYRGHLPDSLWLTQHAECSRKYKGKSQHFKIDSATIDKRRHRYYRDEEAARLRDDAIGVKAAQAMGWSGSNPKTARRFLAKRRMRVRNAKVVHF